MQGIGWRSQIVEEGWDLWRIPLLWRPDTKQCLFRLPIATKFLFNNGERLLYSRLGLSYLPQSHLTAYSKEYFLYCTAKSYDLGYPIDCSRSISLSLSLSLSTPPSPASPVTHRPSIAPSPFEKQIHPPY
jgi:hypothetical protein